MNEEQLGDRAAELALLSVCLWSRNARVQAKKHLLPGDFYWPAHEALYAAMLAMDRAGTDVDPVTLQAHAATLQGPPLHNLVIEVTGDRVSMPENVGEYARIVRGWALRRRVHTEATGLAHRALNPTESPERLAAEAVTALTGLRDHGTETTASSLREVMSQPDDTPSWVIPGLLEREDRLMLTGSEGAGKSALMRQLAIMPAAGIHPFTEAIMPPIRALIVDCENKPNQIRRQARPLIAWLQDHSAVQDDPLDRVLLDTPGRIDLTRDRDLSRLHQTIDAWQPHVVVLGPIYKMSNKALQSDDEAAPFLAALDTITARGCALILEAHAGHGKDGVGKAQQRDLRPRGSSALLGWPEFGLGLRGLGHGLADLEPWRGHRETDRLWPARMRRAPGNRWVETYPDDRPSSYEQAPPPRDEEAPLWPAG